MCTFAHPVLFFSLHPPQRKDVSVWSTDDNDSLQNNEDIVEAVVSEGVTTLFAVSEIYPSWPGVFSHCSNLRFVTLPASLREIGMYAFCSCEKLENVDIPSSVRTIGNHAFNGCRSLQSIVIPEGVVYLPHSVFCDCKSLKSAKLPSSLKTIEDYAFYNCVSLATINLDELKGLIEVGIKPFFKCPVMKDVDFKHKHLQG